MLLIFSTRVKALTRDLARVCASSELSQMGSWLRGAGGAVWIVGLGEGWEREGEDEGGQGDYISGIE